MASPCPRSVPASEIFWAARIRRRCSTMRRRKDGGWRWLPWRGFRKGGSGRWISSSNFRRSAASGSSTIRRIPSKSPSGFCPECFREQMAARRILHLKAEWTWPWSPVVSGTNCRCTATVRGAAGTSPFISRAMPLSNVCIASIHLTIRRWAPTPDSAEPGIAAFERAWSRCCAAQAPDPAWAGELTARSFRASSDGSGLDVDDERTDRPLPMIALLSIALFRPFLPKQPYGEDFAAPFHARSWTQREAVVCAIVQVLLGAKRIAMSACAAPGGSTPAISTICRDPRFGSAQ